MQHVGIAVISPHLHCVGPKNKVILNATTRNCNAIAPGGCQLLEIARVLLIQQDRREVHVMASEMMKADELVADGCHGEFWKLWRAARPALKRSLGRCQ